MVAPYRSTKRGQVAITQRMFGNSTQDLAIYEYVDVMLRPTGAHDCAKLGDLSRPHHFFGPHQASELRSSDEPESPRFLAQRGAIGVRGFRHLRGIVVADLG